MSTFQVILAALGVLAISVFVVVQKWQSYRTQRHIKQAFSPRKNDVLMSEEANLAAVSIRVGDDAGDARVGTVWGRADTELSEERDLLASERLSPATARELKLAVNPVNLDLPLENTDPLLAQGDSVRMYSEPMGAQALLGGAERLPEPRMAPLPEGAELRVDQLMPALQPVLPVLQPSRNDEEARADAGIDPDKKNLASFQFTKESDFEWEEGVSTLPRPTIAEHIDCIAHMMFVRPVSGGRILSYAVRPIARKNTLLEACNENGDWGPVAEDQAYTEVRYAIPYANKSSFLGEIEFSEWVFNLRQIAKGLGAQLSLPSLADVHSRGKALFRFVTDMSQELALNLRPREKLIRQRWNLENVVTVLMQQGFVEVGQDLFEMRNYDRERLYQIHLTLKEDAVLRMTLLLSVALVSEDKSAFEHLLSSAEELCQRFDGVIVDDNNKKLNPTHFDYIREQLKSLYQKMRVARIEAGSANSRRLFL